LARYFKPNIGPTATTGSGVPVAASATESLAALAKRPRSGAAKFTPDVDVAALRAQLGADGIRDVIRGLPPKPSGKPHRPPSNRTIQRWIRANKGFPGADPKPPGEAIPHADVAQALQRAAFIQRHGGVDSVARQLGRSPTTVRRWQKGQQELKPDARKNVSRLQTRDLLRRIGVEDRNGFMKKKANIRVTGGVDVRPGGSPNYQAVRTMQFSQGAGTGLDDATTRELVQALMEGDYDRALQILEAHASTAYVAANNSNLGYTPDTGFHFMDLSSFHLSWE
jgi:hypothetical protein